MGHTQEQRDGNTLCRAKKKNGDVCRAFAGQGTDHPGTGRCKYHGGSTRNHRKAAAVEEAKKRAIEFGEPITNINPAEALLGSLHLSAGYVSWLRKEIRNFTDLDSEEAKALLGMYDAERDRVASLAKACISVGVEAQIVRFTERQGEAIVETFEGAIKAVGGLSNEQRREFGKAIRQETWRLTSAEGLPQIFG